MYRIFHKVPLLFVMMGQYVLVICSVMAGIFIISKITEVSPSAYRDMFIQITLPYIVFAVLILGKSKKQTVLLKRLKK